MHLWKRCTQQLEEYPHCFADLWSNRREKPSEINATIKHSKDAGVEILITFPCSSPIWPVQKTDGSARMTADDHKFKYLVILTEAVVPDVVHCLSQSTPLLVTGMQLLICKWLFLHPCQRPSRAVYFQLARLAVPLQYPISRYINSPALWHKLIFQRSWSPFLSTLYHTGLLHLWHYVDWTCEWEIATITNLLVRYVLESGK